LTPLHAYFEPSAIEHGETSKCIVEGFPQQLHDTEIQFRLQCVDDVATMWVADIGTKIDSVGVAVAEWEPSLKGEQVAELSQVIVPTEGPSPKPQRIWEAPRQVEVARCLLGRKAEISVKELEGLADEFRQKQSVRYARSFGEKAQGALEFEAICIVERLLIRTATRLPGVEILPLGAANAGGHEAELLNEVFGALGRSERMDPEWWAQRSRASRPWAALRVNSIWAQNIEAAATLATGVRERTLHLLAVGRGSSGVPVATLIRPLEAGKRGGIFPELPGYTGNLLGGFLSGEDQHSLLTKGEAIERDPVVALATKLYREARAESNPDFAYFRYWSLLELISDARISRERTVVRLDGSAWPDGGGSTKFAASRVYELLKANFQNVDQQSVVGPAPDLYEAVRGWYGRRNATAHYGAFDPTSDAQQKQSWFKWASRTLQGDNPAGTPGEPWLRGLGEVATNLLNRELHSAGDP
jgi:hypothetical protein